MEYAELGWQEAVILGCAKQEGILEGLANGSRSAEEEAKELRVSPRAAHALFSALAEMGVVAEDGDRFRLLGEHRGPLLDRSHPDYAGGLVVPRIRDVGGGPSTYAEAFAEGGARVTVFDLPEVVELMRRLRCSWDLRCGWGL